MADGNTNQQPAGASAAAHSYRPQDCVEPRLRDVRYPGLQYQLAATATGASAPRQSKTEMLPRQRGRRVVVTTAGLTLTCAVAFTYFAFDELDEASGGDGTPQQAIAVALREEGSAVGRFMSTQPVTPVRVVEGGLQTASAMPDRVVDGGAFGDLSPASTTQADAEPPFAPATASVKAFPVPATPLLQATIVLNLPANVPATRPVVADVVGGHVSAAAASQAASSQSPPGLPAASGAAACSDALSALQLCDPPR